MTDPNHSRFRRRLKSLTYVSAGMVMTAALIIATGTGVAGATQRADRAQSPAAMVTSAIRKLGTLSDGITPYPNSNFLAANGTTWTGWEVQLTQQVVKLLHLHVRFVHASVTADIPGVQSGRWQLSTDDWFVTAQREKVVNFVTDSKSGTRFFELKGSTLKVNSPSDLCGVKVAVKKATVEATSAVKQQHKCAATGKAAMTVQLYPTEAAVTLAIESGRAQVGWTGSTPTNYLVEQQPTKFQVAGSAFTIVTVGMVVSKQYPKLAQAMAAAVNELIKNGEYQKILNKWGDGTGAIRHSTVEPSRA